MLNDVISFQVREGNHSRGQTEGDYGGAELPRNSTAGGGPQATGEAFRLQVKLSGYM